MATAAMPVLLASIGANSALLCLIEGSANGAASFTKLASGSTAIAFVAASRWQWLDTWSLRAAWPVSPWSHNGGSAWVA